MNYDCYSKRVGLHFTRLLRIMKLTLFLIVLFSIKVSAGAYSQQISLTLKDASLKTAITELRKQSKYDFIYDDQYIGKSNPISIHIDKATMEEALRMVFREQPFTYEIYNNAVIIQPKQGINELVTNTRQQSTTRGRVTDTLGNPMQGVSVFLKGTNRGTTTDQSGNYETQNVPNNAILVFRQLGFQTIEIPANRSEINVVMRVVTTEIKEVAILNTGYQSIPQERATGSFVQIDNELLNRKVSTHVLDRLDGVTSGLIFNKNRSTVQNHSSVAIRGRSTIFANPEPLIVLDNFPYEGNIDNINPNDIESVTILKDAAAASIWGAYSGNGVIVITTKKGTRNQKTKVDAHTSVNVIDKPNLYYLPQLTSGQVIEVEKFLYERGFYNASFTSTLRPYISPVVEILRANPDPAVAESLIAPYRDIDNRADMEKYVYRQSINQQHSLSLSGGGMHNQYFMSVGYDQNKGNRVGEQYNRLNINARNTFYLLDDKIKLSSGLLLTTSNTSRTGSSGYSLQTLSARPYELLADEQGNPLAVNLKYRTHYIDTVGQGLLLDWNFRPLDEIRNTNNQSRLTDYRLSTDLEYNIVSGLSVKGLYQFSKGVTNTADLYDIDSYYTRDLINQFSQVNYGNGAVTRPIPIGDILDEQYGSLHSHQFRMQANLNKTFSEAHRVDAIAGYEIRSTRIKNAPQQRLYGYNQETETSILVDVLGLYPLYYGTSTRLPGNSGVRSSNVDNNISYYTNANYTYAGRYILSGSARLDQSNIFGVNTNQKGVPLWSIGGAWNIHEEAFYNVSALSNLKLRITYGYNGNVDKSTSAFVTAGVAQVNFFGSPTMRIINPPNPDLRWEQIGILNTGLDFKLTGGRVHGSMEYYTKKGKDLMGNMPYAPQTGIIQFRGNVADIKGNGIDLILHTENLTGRFKWNTSLLYSYTQNKIVDYKMPIPSATQVVSPTSINPVNGKPLYGIYSYKWAGLDNAGNPQGLLEGSPSNNYAAIMQTVDYMDVVKFHGSADPIHFGSFRNTFQYNGLNLSVNILYKLDYYFRENLISNTPFFNFPVYPDFDNRWINPGDEQHTSVPSLVYPNNTTRSVFYQQSELHIHRGDHIRLQDIQLSYHLGRYTKQWGINNTRLFFYANNIGILWKANKGNIDPDFISAMPNPRSYAMGLSFNL